ncbi:putative quinol monooxygenase [Pseudomonas sp. H11T01]|uniref:putative quinol monooxygenase n=1 Tax=Pseudomonas sp. H11T01 TaxID=3402749 RepID=UPI003AD26619
MSSTAINTVQIQAAQGRSDELGLHLTRIADTLREVPGCLDYAVQECPSTPGLWTVNGHWQTRECMESHFTLPALQGYIELIGNHLACRLDFNH